MPSLLPAPSWVSFGSRRPGRSRSRQCVLWRTPLSLWERNKKEQHRGKGSRGKEQSRITQSVHTAHALSTPIKTCGKPRGCMQLYSHPSSQPHAPLWAWRMGSASDAQTLHEAMAPHPPNGNLGETNRIRMGPTFQIWPPKYFREESLSSTRPACSRTQTPHGSLG